jgi:nucleoside-diphosphate-sugar epimerase
MDRNDRILITGGTGFIGGRLVEVLASRGFRIRVTTSDFRNCARISRFPVEMIKADLRDHEALTRAVADCNVVFHFGYRFVGTPMEQQRTNLEGTRTLAQEFLKNGGRRFIHISSVTAYGDPCDGEVTENSPQRPSKMPYSDTKQKIEQMLRELYCKRGLPITILQPTIVYGPYGSFFTVRLLEEIKSSRIVLPEGGLGLCNSVYVDDVVSAAILAATRDEAIGEAFLISGSAPTTWREFYSAYEKMLGKKAVIDLDAADLQIERDRQQRSRSIIERLRRALAKRPAFRERLLGLPPQRWLVAGGQKILPYAAKAAIKRRYEALWKLSVDASASNPPLFFPDGFWGSLYAARTHVRIDKAREKLGYNPAFDLEDGMARTAEWARWANLLSP